MTMKVPGYMLRDLSLPATSVTYNHASGGVTTVQEAIDSIAAGGGTGASDPTKLDKAGGEATGEIYYDPSVEIIAPRALVSKDYVDSTFLYKQGGEASGLLSYSAGLVPVGPQDLVTKSYVDSNSGGSGGGIRIAVIGDSLSAQNHLMAPSWPSLVEQTLHTCSIDAKVFNFAVPAATYHTAVNTQNNGATQLEKAIAVDPHIVIVSLGINETLNAVGGLTFAQMEEARDLLYSTLRAQLPAAKIVYMDQVFYDTSKYSLSPANPLPNKGTMLYYFNKRTSGILAGCYSSEIMADQTSSTFITRAQQWLDLRYALADNSPKRDVAGRFDLWKIARMGGCVYDGLHLSGAGQMLMRGYAMKALLSPVLADLLPGLTVNPTANVNDPDAMFTGMFDYVAATGDYVYKGTVANVMGNEDSLFNGLRPLTWFLPRDMTWQWSHGGSKSLRFGLDSVFVRSISGAKPNTVVQVSVNGGAWADSSDYTNAFGQQVSGNDAASLAAYANTTTTFRYRVGDIVCDPLELTISSNSGHGTSLTGNITLSPSHMRGVIRNATTSTHTITIPPSSSTPLPIGIPAKLCSASSGSINVVAGSGVTLLRKAGAGTAVVSGGAAELIQINSNTWSLSGDLSTA